MEMINYVSPSIDIVEIEIESVILTASGEDSFVDWGE